MFEYTFDSKLGAQSSNQVYDLCGVVNHIGSSLYSGHYTAFSRTHDANDTAKDELGWRLFDDSRVVSVKNEEQVITPDAYVLMYRLRSGESIEQNCNRDSILNSECSKSTVSYCGDSASVSTTNKTLNTLNDTNLPINLTMPIHLLEKNLTDMNSEREQEAETLLEDRENELSLSSTSSSSPSEQIDENDDREIDFFSINNELNNAIISPIVKQNASLPKRFSIDGEKVFDDEEFTNLYELD
jgi:hypothetical protein